MEKTIGFIGTGNMGKAIIQGMLAAGLSKPGQIIASRKNTEALGELQQELGIRTATENTTVAREADILFLAVKPHFYQAIIQEVRDVVRPDSIVINIAAGISVKNMEDWFGRPMKIVRVMPNTPILVGAGMAAMCANGEVTVEDLAEVQAIFSSSGKAVVVEERLFDAVIGVSGSSPALLYMLVEAMADAAVEAGLPRKDAYTFAAQAMLGTAKMVLETGLHPGELKDQVCSPGGTTIAGVARAEEVGLRGAMIESVRATITKSREMAQ